MFTQSVSVSFTSYNDVSIKRSEVKSTEELQMNQPIKSLMCFYRNERIMFLEVRNRNIKWFGVNWGRGEKKEEADIVLNKKMKKKGKKEGWD